MGLISKIEDKLHSGKGESDSSKLQKSSYEDSGSSHLRHPVSSGAATSGYGNSATATGATSGYGSSTTGATGATGAAGAMGGSSAMPGSYDDAGRTSVERDGYGQSTSGYAKDSRDTSGAYSSSGRSDPRDATTTGGYGSSARTDPRDTTSGGYGSGPREPYDPYSSKGQTTAANAATGYPGGSTTSREDYANEPNVPRSREGGVMNPGSHPSSRNPDAIPTAGGQTVGSSGDPYSNTSSSRADPYNSSTQTSSGHPIRDAAMMGGAGAAGAGAAGYGASRMGRDERSAQDPSMAYGQHATSTNPQDVSYMNRSSGGSAMDSSTGSGMGSTAQPGQMGGMDSMNQSSTMGSNTQSAGTTGASGGSSMPGMDPKKMGGAYEAGYRDAMEHAKAEMGMK